MGTAWIGGNQGEETRLAGSQGRMTADGPGKHVGTLYRILHKLKSAQADSEQSLIVPASPL